MQLIKRLKKLSQTIIVTIFIIATPSTLHAMQKIHKLDPSVKLGTISLVCFGLTACACKKNLSTAGSDYFMFRATLISLSFAITCQTLLKALVCWIFKINLRDLISEGETRWACLWIILGANVHERYRYGGTPLTLAAKKGINGQDNNTIVKMLLKYGADVNARNIWGRTALMYASSAGHLSIVKTLINAGANTLTYFKRNALVRARIRRRDNATARLNKPKIQQILRFHMAKQELAPRLKKLIYKKQAASQAQEVIDTIVTTPAEYHSTRDISGIIKGYL